MRLLARQGKIEALRVGKVWIVTPSAVEAYLALGIKRGPKPKEEGPPRRRR